MSERYEKYIASRYSPNFIKIVSHAYTLANERVQLGFPENESIRACLDRAGLQTFKVSYKQSRVFNKVYSTIRNKPKLIPKKTKQQKWTMKLYPDQHFPEIKKQSIEDCLIEQDLEANE